MTYQYFGYIHVPIFFSLFKLTIYTRLNINKYIIPIKNTICEQNACIQFPFNKYIKHLVPPQAGQSTPVWQYTQHCGIKFIYVELTKLYTKVDLLIIDDLGIETMNDWMLSKLFVIVNERMKNELPIIITTNYELDQLKQRLSIPNKVCETTNSIISRLYQMCYRVECKGNDYRMN